MKETYLQCGEKYRLHYEERIRPNYIGSPLFFGSALDEAFNRLLLEKKKEHTEEEKSLYLRTPQDIFMENMRNVSINGEMVQIAKSDQVRYFNSDFDASLLSEADVAEIVKFADSLAISVNDLSDIEQFMEEIKNVRKTTKTVDNKENLLYNNISWHSLVQKGLLMIAAYESDLLPQIEEVYEIQKQVSLVDDSDELIGFIDFTASFVDRPRVVYVCDNKSSSRAYSPDSVKESKQLATYVEHEDTNHAAYLVVEKKIRKREPKTRTQIVRDEISEDFVQETFDELSGVFYNIVDKKFDKAYTKEGGDKNCYAFGQRCQFYDYCRNGSLENLVRKK